MLIYIIVEINTPKPVNWEPSYSIQEKSPMGLYVVNDLLPYIFKEKKIITVFESPYSFLREKKSILKPDRNSANYIILSNSFESDKYDITSLKNFVQNGNNCFIAANTYSKQAMELLNIETGLSLNSPVQTKENHTAFSFNYSGNKKTYFFKTKYSGYYFKSIPPSSKIVMKNQNNKPVLIVSKHGKGFFMLSTTPDIFTNNSILYSKNERLVFSILSILPVRNTFMDEYFTAYGKGQSSPLRVILRDDSLKRVYYSSMVFLFLFILFKARRKQRIIPVTKSPENESLKFIEMVGKLYYQKGDNKDLAEKKILFFYEYIRTRYSVSANKISLEELSAKINVEIEDLKKLFDLMKIIETSGNVKDKDLILLHNLIYNITSA